MEKLRTIGKNWIQKTNNAPLKKLDWIMLAVMSVFIFLTMFYSDMIIIYNHSLTFWDSVFSMDMGNFYANTLQKPYLGFGAVYYWIIYAVIGLWNLPIWILQKCFAINVFSVKCMLWCRLEVVLFFVLTLYMMEKIMKDYGFGKEKCRFAQFMFASSLMVVLPVVAISQIDIITVFFMLWGLREYLKTDRITWKFLLIFSFASAMKIFALFVFIPLIMLREKRILYVIWDIFVGLWFIMAGRLPYIGNVDYANSTSVLTNVMVERMFETTFPTGNVQSPAFIAILIAISIWAYITKIERKETYFYYANWIALAVFAAFFVFVYAHPYWIVLLAPYMIFSIVMNPNLMKINLILEYFAATAASLFYCATFRTYMTGETFSYMLLARLGFEPKNIGLDTGLAMFVENAELQNYVSAVFTVFVVCVGAFVVINRPGKQAADMTWHKQVDAPLQFEHGMIYLRLVTIFAFIMGCIYFAYIR